MANREFLFVLFTLVMALLSGDLDFAEAAAATLEDPPTTRVTAIHVMDPGDLLGLLSLFIALSAYVATIRLFAIEKLQDPEYKGDKTALRKRTACLTIADAPMVSAAVLLGLHVFFADLFGRPGPEWLSQWSVILFGIGALALVAFHIDAWIRSIRALSR